MVINILRKDPMLKYIYFFNINKKKKYNLYNNFQKMNKLVINLI